MCTEDDCGSRVSHSIVKNGSVPNVFFISNRKVWKSFANLTIPQVYNVGNAVLQSEVDFNY